MFRFFFSLFLRYSIMLIGRDIMKKKEFLNKLEKKLTILNSNERKKVLKSYENKIDELIEKGQDETDAISSLESIDNIVKKVLASYSINTEYQDNNFSLSDFFSDLTKRAKDFLTSIFNGSIEELLNFLLKILILFIFIVIFHIPFSLIRELVIHFLEFLPSVIKDSFIILWRIFVEFSYIIISALILFSNLKSDFKYFRKNKSQNDDRYLKEFSNNLKKVLRVVYNLFIIIFSIPLLFLFILSIILVALLLTLFSKGVFLCGTIIFIVGLGMLIFSLLVIIFNSVKAGDR